MYLRGRGEGVGRGDERWWQALNATIDRQARHASIVCCCTHSFHGVIESSAEAAAAHLSSNLLQGEIEGHACEILQSTCPPLHEHMHTHPSSAKSQSPLHLSLSLLSSLILTGPWQQQAFCLPPLLHWHVVLFTGIPLHGCKSGWERMECGAALCTGAIVQIINDSSAAPILFSPSPSVMNCTPLGHCINLQVHENASSQC